MDWFIALSATTGESPRPGGPPLETPGIVNKDLETVTVQNLLDALYKLLRATPDVVFMPSLPQIKRFIHRFDKTGGLTFSYVNKRVRCHQNFACALYFN